ncbi:MAG: IS200/IS605 family transposase [Planctomycetes bacterium]|nr:IS200/IS605 family transposase [Planctomycetota bacterium]
MPQSFVSLHVHVVFSTKNRIPLIDDDLQPRLFEYFGGILRGCDSALIAAGGMPDHVHLLCSLGKQSSMADVVRTVKTNSSKWIHETFDDRRDFAWQSGYGGFAVSYSNIEEVRRYFASQAEHHARRSFKDELRALLERHHIACDERYLWD